MDLREWKLRGEPGSKRKALSSTFVAAFVSTVAILAFLVCEVALIVH